MVALHPGKHEQGTKGQGYAATMSCLHMLHQGHENMTVQCSRSLLPAQCLGSYLASCCQCGSISTINMYLAFFRASAVSLGVNVRRSCDCTASLPLEDLKLFIAKSMGRQMQVSRHEFSSLTNLDHTRVASS